jgi:hypothetical protein
VIFCFKYLVINIGVRVVLRNQYWCTTCILNVNAFCFMSAFFTSLLPVRNGSTTDPADPMSGKDQPAKKKFIKLKALPSSELSQCMPVEVLPGMCLNHLSTASP